MKLRLNSADQVTGFLDKGTRVTGELEFSGMLRIDGSFHGSISTDGILAIGEHAVVHADIKAGEVKIHGHVLGNVESKRRIEVFPTGRVRGDICSPILVMNPGALVDGSVRMSGDPPSETTIAAPDRTKENTRQERP